MKPRRTLLAIVATLLAVSLSGCIILPERHHRHHNHHDRYDRGH
ncbi:hypothetical protein [Pelomonas sp. SE-A7]|nr:hypothetical protein [Pelomonas sp. SE-A7]MDM4765943.1 hypothetical protein [Pelomonas sp. SE-A7]